MNEVFLAAALLCTRYVHLSITKKKGIQKRLEFYKADT